MFLARANVTVAVFDTERSSLRRVSRLNNYLGFPEGISGSDLLDISRRQAERFGAHVFGANVETAARREGRFVVTTEDGVYGSDYFVIASNKRTDLASSLGLQQGGFGSKFVSVDADGRTAVENCYAAGRITGLPSQAVISGGDGAKTAIAIVQKIRGAYYVDHDT